MIHKKNDRNRNQSTHNTDGLELIFVVKFWIKTRAHARFLRSINGWSCDDWKIDSSLETLHLRAIKTAWSPGIKLQDLILLQINRKEDISNLKVIISPNNEHWFDVKVCHSSNEIYFLYIVPAEGHVQLKLYSLMIKYF